MLHGFIFLNQRCHLAKIDSYGYYIDKGVSMDGNNVLSNDNIITPI